MDRRQFFGDSIVGTLVRLVLLSIAVGIVFSVLNITPYNLVDRLQQIIRNIMNLGFDAFGWAINYFLLGAIIVFPIWFVVRLFRRTPGGQGR
ncbi:MAG: integrase [Hyphomicrobiaceae bacterium]|nr:MAG: integrase [Hyphomicrobiaceae bacterium]